VQNRHHPWLRAEDGGDVVVGFAGMDDHRLAGLGRQGELGLEGGVLAFPGRMMVVVVEPHLPGGDHPGIPQPPAQPVSDLTAPARGVMGVNTRRGGKPGLGPGQREGAIGCLGRFAHDDHALDPRPPGPLQHFGAIGVVG
jgi:hypothetical protein